jgi:hypothetical protein
MPSRFADTTRAGFISTVLVVWVLGVAQIAHAATPAEIFSRHTPGSTQTVDHGAFNTLLDSFVEVGGDGIARVGYRRWKSEGHAALKAYIGRLEAVDVAALDRPEQFAYWANLYNAKTLDIVLEHYPVRSIKDISLGGGLVALVTGGPWKAKVMKVAGEDLSLDDIEHGILRPVFKDPRVHYAVNCASNGCPNLGKEAFTGARLNEQLEAAARAFVNHPRGASVTREGLTVSSIYSWFKVDFGGDDKGVIAHLKRYADAPLAAKLKGLSVISDDQYDWSLNDIETDR